MQDRLGEPISPAAVLRALAAIIAGDNSQGALLSRTCAATQAVVPGADAVSVTVLDNGGPRTAAASEEMALQADQAQYATDSGPCLEALRRGHVVQVPDLARETRWPQYVEQAARLGVRASLSVPLAVDERAGGALNIYATETAAFDAEAVDLAVELAQFAGVLTTSADQHHRADELAEQLQRAMDSRAVIEQAKGIVMAQRRCTPDEAFAHLVRLSQESHRKLRELAEMLVAGTVAG